jgi:hypothetical protein
LVTSRLSRLQREILDAFFKRETRFFLTGGAALAGFHLGHRATEDLDLFATSNLLENGEGVLSAVADDIGGFLEKIITSPDFRRFLVKRGKEGVVVDLVFDRSAQGVLEKQKFGNISVDPPEEILANKLCAVLSRSELRDLVDILALEDIGLKVEDALPLARQKDSGLTAAQLAWLLSGIGLGDETPIPGDVSRERLETFLKNLEARLRRLAFPGNGAI